MNLIGLDRKLDSDFERNQLKMIWDACVWRSFIKYIFEKDNFVELSKQGLTYQKANNIVLNFIEKDKQNIYLLKLAVKNNLKTIQFCYLALYPKIYARTNSFGIENKANFDFIYNEWKKNKNALPFNQTLVVLKQERNAANFQNCVPHPAEHKRFEMIDLTNVDGKESPETFEKTSPILPGERFVPETKKDIPKKTIKTDAKSLNDARIAKTNEKKRTFKKTITAKH